MDIYGLSFYSLLMWPRNFFLFSCIPNFVLFYLKLFPSNIVETAMINILVASMFTYKHHTTAASTMAFTEHTLAVCFNIRWDVWGGGAAGHKQTWWFPRSPDLIELGQMPCAPFLKFSSLSVPSAGWVSVFQITAVSARLLKNSRIYAAVSFVPYSRIKPLLI